jgi:hypothetical protein
MTPLGAAGSSPVNTFAVLKEAKARLNAKRSGASTQGSTAPTAVQELTLPRTNSFQQKIESDGLPTTVIYDAFGRFRQAILPKGQVVDIYM